MAGGANLTPFVLRFQTNETRRPAGPKGGQFKSVFLAKLAEVNFLEQNERMAKELQAEAVKTLKKGTLRPKVQTGRLARATAAPENRYADKLTWGVGLPDWLDQSEAKYWRTIDEGSATVWKHKFAGTFYYVNKSKAFGRSLGGYGDNFSLAGPKYERAGAGVGGILRPMVRAHAEEIIANNGVAPRWLGKVYITKEIAPQDYYNKAFAQQGGIRRSLRVYVNKIDQLWRGY